MEDQKTEEQNRTEEQPKEEARETITVQPKKDKSQFEKWKKQIRAVKKKCENTIVLLTKHKATISDLLSQSIRTDKGYQPVSWEILKEILKGIKANPRKEPFNKILANLHDLETHCGIELSVNLPLYRWKAKGVSKYPLFELKSNQLVKLTGKKNPQPERKLSKSYPPLDVIELKDVTSWKKHKESVFLDLISNLENRYYPAVIKYKYGFLYHRGQYENIPNAALLLS